jgi:hypothetical protein
MQQARSESDEGSNSVLLGIMATMNDHFRADANMGTAFCAELLEHAVMASNATIKARRMHRARAFQFAVQL